VPEPHTGLPIMGSVPNAPAATQPAAAAGASQLQLLAAAPAHAPAEPRLRALPPGKRAHISLVQTATAAAAAAARAAAPARKTPARPRQAWPLLPEDGPQTYVVVMK
jgi:hypothetical protein